MRIAFSIIACALLACCAIQSPQAGPVGFRLPSAAPFSPTNLPGLILWLDASQISGLSDGDSVTNWLDLSGNSNNATQSTASKRPTYQTNEQNGRAGVLGDGTDDVLDFSSAVIPRTNFSFYVVLRQPSTASLLRIAGNCDSGSIDGFILINGSLEGPRYWILRNSGGGGSDISMSPVPSVGTTYVLRLIMGDSVTTAYVNGASRGTSTCVALGVSGQNLQLFNDGASSAASYSNCYLFEILAYNTAHDLQTQSQIEVYLNNRWNAY